jgi:predicted MPP superfamily phosphohydrolase
MLRASGEKLSVIGNWELKKSRCKNISYWRTKYADSGFKLLNDSSLLAGKILFHGLSPSRGIYKKNEMETTDEKDFFSLMIAHTPDDIVSSKRYFNLALSGHTHGGQIRIPFIGALKTSSKHWKKFEYGLFTKDDNTQMIVSSGLGTSCFPVRLFCEPEIVVLDMKPC